ncbi:MAG: cell wall anchor protein [Cyanobacteria bacterium K_Offshore_surface_m2_239]|nr:cell wall anchor protein [Cyanobacteria bacterium K_Offshore_surface_m2_239]
MTVTASSGSTRVNPQLYDTLPLSSVRQAEQQDRFPDGGELQTLINFFQSGRVRVEAAQRLSANAAAIVAKAADRIFVGGTPLSYLDGPLGGETSGSTPLAADQEAFQRSVRTFVGTTSARKGNVFSRLLEGAGGDADVRVVLPSGFNPISVGVYGTERMKKSIRDLAWFLRYVGYALVAGDPSILAVNTRGLRDVLEKACSLAATNVALQEMRAAAAGLFQGEPEARSLVIECFNVLLKELELPTPSTRQRLGSPVNQGLQLPAIYALAAEGRQRFVMKPGLSGREKAEVIRAAYRQVFERDIVKGYSLEVCPVEATQCRQGQISMREFVRAMGRSKEYQKQFYGRFSNSRVVELAFRHFLGRGLSSIEEFRYHFAIVSTQGLKGLVDVLVNSMEYARVFGEETVPYLRDLGEEAQESAGWGSNRKLFRFSAPFEGAPQYITLYASYRQPLPDQHAYGGGNDPLALTYGAIFPSGTASVATRAVPFSYDSRRILISNGLSQPGQMASPQFRKATPRRVGPRVVRLKQIATGGNSVPQRGGQPSVRGTEAATQAVIRAVYVQVLGNSGYAGERNTVEEIKLENGDISLREFVRQVARSDAFRRRYWSGLYICKAIEVIHRRLLGRPTFGRWEIDSYFDTAARKGFYGVVDAMINSPEYTSTFGEDTVPYERFITPADLNTRRVPALRRPLNLEAIPDLRMTPRPNVPAPQQIRTTADLTPRNLPSRPTTIRGGWSAQIAGGETLAPAPAASGPTSLRQPPAPARTWRPQNGAAAGWSASVAAAPVARTTAFRAPASPPAIGVWKAAVSAGGPTLGSGPATMPSQAMEKALRSVNPQGFRRRQSLGQAVELPNAPSEGQLKDVVRASYRQLLNRVPFAAERLLDAESQLRNGRVLVAEFVGLIASSDLFLQRLNRLAPLRAAAAAHLALLGRAALPAETSRFLATRTSRGLPAAVQQLLGSEEYASAFGRSTVPFLRGLSTQDGVPLATVNRSAELYGGNGGLTPNPRPAI